MTYNVLIGDSKAYELAPRSAKVVKELRRLQVSSSYYDEAERYGIAKDARLLDWIVSEEEDIEKDQTFFTMKEAVLSMDDFRVEVAKLLFPAAKITEEKVDLGVVEEGLSAFLNFIEPRRLKLKNMLPLLMASQVAQTSGTNQETQEVAS